MKNARFFRYALLSSIAATALTAHAAAQETAPPVQADEAASEEIVVTARKREETSIAVPVTITAVGQAELERRAITSLDNVARVVPQLVLGEGGGTVQGGTIALRGIAGPDTNPFGDQAVSFNIDGVQVAKTSVRRLGQFDMAQIEVLKGPQALFFGKNSPGGIISIRTADPTAEFAAKASLGYEINAHEWRADGYVSGPLTDTLGFRLAAYWSDMRGWVDNIVPEDNPYAPKFRHGPRANEFDIRGTLKFEPSEVFDARLKFTYGRVRGAGSAYNFQYIFCPDGLPQFVGIIDECRANSKVSHADMGTSFTPFEPFFGDGVTFSRSNQQLGSLEMNYKPSDHLTLTSVTGYYRFKYVNSEQFTTGGPVEPLPELFPGFGFGLPLLPSAINYYNREWSQELRLQSDFDGPINFTVGGLIQKTRATTGAHTFARPEAPIEFNQYFFVQKGSAWSIFGQLMWDVVPTLELAAGGRYSHEKKSLPLILSDPTANPAAPMVEVFADPDTVSFNDFSPEFTASWRPTQNLTVFGSYKRGFLSGGFNSSSTDFVEPIDYEPQKVRGFEGGVKTAMLNGALRVNFAAYYYKILGLQITAFNNTVGTIRNAGKVSVKGAEFDFNYRTPLEGLTLRGALSYNKGKYLEYVGPCYAGQTPALGCNTVNAFGTPAQELSGTELVNAPKWTGYAGLSYETPIGTGLKIGISGDINFSSSQLTDAKSNPNGRSPKRALVDATLRLAEADDLWEVALIGRNLTDKYYWSNSQDVPLAGPLAGRGIADLFAVVSRGREIMIRGTVKFGQ